MFLIKCFVHTEINIDLWQRKERQTELQLEQNYCTWLWPSSCCRAFGSLTRGNSTIALCAMDTNKEVLLSNAKYSHWHYYDRALILQKQNFFIILYFFIILI